jgi:hypothetical protein
MREVCTRYKQLFELAVRSVEKVKYGIFIKNKIKKVFHSPLRIISTSRASGAREGLLSTAAYLICRIYRQAESLNESQQFISLNMSLAVNLEQCTSISFTWGELMNRFIPCIIYLF